MTYIIKYTPFLIFSFLTFGNSILVNFESKNSIFLLSYFLVFIYFFSNLKSVFKYPNPFLLLIVFLSLFSTILNNSFEIAFIIIFSLFLRDFHIDSFVLWAKTCLIFILFVLALWYLSFIDFEQFYTGYYSRGLRSDKLSLVFRNPNTIFTYLVSCLCIFYRRNNLFFFTTLIIYFFCQYITNSISSLVALSITFLFSLMFYRSNFLKAYFAKFLLIFVVSIPFIIYIFYDTINFVVFENYDLNFLLSGRLQLIYNSFANWDFYNLIFGFRLENIDNSWIEFIALGMSGIFLIFGMIFSIKNSSNPALLDILIFVLIFGLVENIISFSIPLIYFLIYMLRYENKIYKLEK